MIAAAIEEGVPTSGAGQGPASWQEVHAGFRALVEGISRTATRGELETAAEVLSSLADDILSLLETQAAHWRHAPVGTRAESGFRKIERVVDQAHHALNAIPDTLGDGTRFFVRLCP
jgi:hypothetical protein